METLSTFIRLSGPIPEVKHSALINNFENIIAYREKCWVKWGVDKKVWFVPNTYGGSMNWCHHRKVLLFLLSFNLINSIPSTLIKKLLYKHEHIFFLKTSNFKLGPSHSPTNIPCLKDYLHNIININSRRL